MPVQGYSLVNQSSVFQFGSNEQYIYVASPPESGRCSFAYLGYPSLPP
jgi:hypothetical protein